MQLQDDGLLKTQAFIDGSWHDADNGSTTPVLNPATGETLAQVARCGREETRRAIAAAHRAQLDWRQRTADERSAALAPAPSELMLVSSRRPVPDHHYRTGQTAGGIAPGNRIRRRLHAMVCRGSAACIWGHYPQPAQGPAPARHQTACRGGCLHHTLEFPQCHAGAQTRSSPGKQDAPWYANQPTRRPCPRWPWRNCPMRAGIPAGAVNVLCRGHPAQSGRNSPAIPWYAN